MTHNRNLKWILSVLNCPSTAIRDWFGADFQRLHPLLQALHTQGGTLAGMIHISFAKGLGGYVGRRLASKLGIPTNLPECSLQVDIAHHASGLHWNRSFNRTHAMESVFQPVGTYQNGYCEERTEAIAFCLTVDIVDGAWHWRCLNMRLKGIPLPLWLFPQSQAFKRIEVDRYYFFVGFSLPLLGTVLSYSGRLDATLKAV
jgi:hypothetical protein